MRCEVHIYCSTTEEAARVTAAIAGRPRSTHEWVWRTGQITRCARCGVMTEVAVEPCSGKTDPAPATPPIPGPTPRDAAAGMLEQHGWVGTAGEVKSGKISLTEAAWRLRCSASDGSRGAGTDACIAALESLAAREACRVGHGADEACAECAPNEQPGGVAPDREALGRAVHEVWRETAMARGIPHAVAWEDIDESVREEDRRIGERLFAMGVAHERSGVLSDIARIAAADTRPAGDALIAHLAALGEAAKRMGQEQSEVEALRKRVEELEAEYDKHRALVVDLRAILGADPDRSLREEARRVVSERDRLKAEARAAREELGARGDEPLLAAARRVADALAQELGGEGRRRALAEAREQGAAEMRERAACEARQHATGIGAARAIRALQLTAEPTVDPVVQEVPADADERWQPGAAWEHRAYVVRRLEIRQVDEVRGLAFLNVAGTWSAMQSIPRAEMTEANGWRYVGRPASEARPTRWSTAWCGRAAMWPGWNWRRRRLCVTHPPAALWREARRAPVVFVERDDDGATWHVQTWIKGAGVDSPMFGARFSGPDAEPRALEYAAWVNARGEVTPEQALRARRAWGCSAGAADGAPNPGASEVPVDGLTGLDAGGGP